MMKRDKIRRKNVRGKAYNMDKIMELFDQGYNYQQIAKKVAYQIIAELAAFR